MGKSIKEKTFSGILWSAMEKFSLQGVQFIVQIIMARLMLPADYGLLGMLAVFIQFSQTLVDSGFANALIRKKDRTEVDYSTVFFFNVFLSLCCYAVLFFIAPFVADYYNIPELTTVMRVFMLTIIVSSLFIIPKTKLTIALDFKSQAHVSLPSVLLSGVVGIAMAYYGMGVWALVWQSILYNLLLMILFFFRLRWKPLFVFSISSLRKMSSFGMNLLAQALIHIFYSNILVMIIGRNAESLGYYNRAMQFAMFPSSNLSIMITRVTYPVLSTLQDDDERLKLMYKKYVQLSSYLIFPLMFGLAALAEPLILVLLTDKWAGAILILQILCLDWMFDHLTIASLNTILAKGRSDLTLQLEIVKKVIGITILFIMIPYGLIGICWGRVINALINTYLNTLYVKKVLKVSSWIQLKAAFPSFFLALFMGGVVYWSTTLALPDILKLVLGIVIGAIVYITGSHLFRIESFRYLLNFLRKGKES